MLDIISKNPGFVNNMIEIYEIWQAVYRNLLQNTRVNADVREYYSNQYFLGYEKGDFFVSDPGTYHYMKKGRFEDQIYRALKDSNNNRYRVLLVTTPPTIHAEIPTIKILDQMPSSLAAIIAGGFFTEAGGVYVNRYSKVHNNYNLIPVIPLPPDEKELVKQTIPQVFEYLRVHAPGVHLETLDKILEDRPQELSVKPSAILSLLTGGEPMKLILTQEATPAEIHPSVSPLSATASPVISPAEALLPAEEPQKLTLNPETTPTEIFQPVLPLSATASPVISPAEALLPAEEPQKPEITLIETPQPLVATPNETPYATGLTQGMAALLAMAAQTPSPMIDPLTGGANFDSPVLASPQVSSPVVQTVSSERVGGSPVEIVAEMTAASNPTDQEEAQSQDEIDILDKYETMMDVIEGELETVLDENFNTAQYVENTMKIVRTKKRLSASQLMYPQLDVLITHFFLIRKGKEDGDGREARFPVLIWYMAHANLRSRHAWGKLETLAHDLGYGKPRIVAALNWLVKRGALRRVAKYELNENQVNIRSIIYEVTGRLQVADDLILEYWEKPSQAAKEGKTAQKAQDDSPPKTAAETSPQTEPAATTSNMVGSVSETNGSGNNNLGSVNENLLVVISSVSETNGSGNNSLGSVNDALPLLERKEERFLEKKEDSEKEEYNKKREKEVDEALSLLINTFSRYREITVPEARHLYNRLVKVQAKMPNAWEGFTKACEIAYINDVRGNPIDYIEAIIRNWQEEYNRYSKFALEENLAGDTPSPYPLPQFGFLKKVEPKNDHEKYKVLEAELHPERYAQTALQPEPEPPMQIEAGTTMILDHPPITENGEANQTEVGVTPQ